MSNTPAARRPRRTSGAPWRARQRRLGVLGALALALLLGGCHLPNFYGYRGSTSQGNTEHLLWSATFIASLVIGGIVALLILWSVFRYRRRSDEMPRQVQYHLPLEIAYTIIPVVIVLVLFGFTFAAENRIDALEPHTVQTVDINAFQWGWQFRYVGQGVTITGEEVGDPNPVGLNGQPCAPAVDCYGPGLVLPVRQSVLVNLRSKDTVHGFYVPEFNFSRYAQPGILNQFQLTANRSGIFRAQCTQFCGLYHSEMFFHVVALPPSQFRAWLASERTASNNSGAGASAAPTNATPTPTTRNSTGNTSTNGGTQ